MFACLHTEFVTARVQSNRNNKEAAKSVKEMTFYSSPHDLGISTIVSSINYSTVGFGAGAENEQSVLFRPRNIALRGFGNGTKSRIGANSRFKIRR